MPSISLVAPLIIALVSPRPDDPLAAERARHQGTWTVVAMIRDDTPAPAEVLDSIRRKVDGDHVVWTRNGKNFAGTRFEVDPATTPATIDLIPDGGKDRDTHVLGITKWEGDTLAVCVADAGRPRPVDFSAKPGSRQTLQTFRRDVPKPKPGGTGR